MWADNRKSSVGDSCQPDGWHHQTVGASRMKRSTARQISDTIEWTKVPWRESVQDFVLRLGIGLAIGLGIGIVPRYGAIAVG